MAKRQRPSENLFGGFQTASQPCACPNANAHPKPCASPRG
ncbi:hypothetical protein HMPREF9123_1452 [Neisseria bacilliformis ATCC BAA-1200]|uniref:Uncharacterized protein n=1 Tax=Neisseria bacilliformis ATCC BAA-1200 TaxID=888742 RepID=F2BCJ7_9NEIS|nr:hypothetical protein HMPREF9123_1452 [Neisseria bacilliformis ATCC BAA-1200]